MNTKIVTALDFCNANEIKEIFVALNGISGCTYEQDLYGNLINFIETELFCSYTETQDFWKSEGEVLEEGKSWSWNGKPNLIDSRGNYYTTISLYTSEKTKREKIMKFNKVFKAVKESDEKHQDLLDQIIKDCEELRSLCPMYEDITIQFGEFQKLVLTNSPYFFFLENEEQMFTSETKFEEKDYDRLLTIANILSLIRNS